jgi:hypothetical protein
VELFNPEYYKQDAMTVAKTAFDKTKKIMDAALSQRTPA